MNRCKRFRRAVVYSLFSLAALTLLAAPGFAQVLIPIFTEDFEGLELGPFLDENLPAIEGLDNTKVWTKTPPEGWTVDNSELAGIDEDVGVPDWRGWTFASWQAWTFAAGDQRRSEFTKAIGTIAIADPDEWDDTDPDPESFGTYNTVLNTPPISLAGVAANTAVLTFDSSWRPEDFQQVTVTAVYDAGEPVELLYWNSFDGDPNFHPDDTTNETVSIDLNNPAGASEMVLRWAMWEAGNDWWWAIDNIQVTSGDTTIFSEDFEGLDLGPFQMESVPSIEAMDNTVVWTKTPPEGWTVDDSEMPFDGVRDWRGWSFASVAAWAFVAGDQRRSEFTKATGTAAIADPDEWDDMDHEAGDWNGYLSTPPISLANVEPNSVMVSFDSSWRPEAPQEAALTVSFDGGDSQTLLYWTSFDGDEFFHPDTSTNETVTVDANNPAGVSEMVLRWELFYAGNNWFWAIDNVLVSVPATAVENWSLY